MAVNFRADEKSASKPLNDLDGAGHAPVQADVSAPDGAKSAVDESVSRRGGDNIVVNIAGIFELHPLDLVDFDEWQSARRRTIDVNLIGPANIR